MFDTALTRVLGIDVLIVQAPIANLTCPELVAGVSNAGALEMLSVTWRRPEEIRPLVRRTRELIDRPFGVNLVLAWNMRRRLAVCLEGASRWCRSSGATRRHSSAACTRRAR